MLRKTQTREVVNRREADAVRLSCTLGSEMELRYNAAWAVVFACLLCLCHGYTLRSSVSWAVPTTDVVEDADLSEEDAPALLADSAGLWKQAYPSTSALADSVDSPGEIAKSNGDSVAQLSSRLFSYRLDKIKKTAARGTPGPPPHQETARTARYIAHYSDWGHLATISTQDKVIVSVHRQNFTVEVECMKFTICSKCILTAVFVWRGINST